tara:strand:- start:1045 stop:1341 length:297 start_codon:yes stop_codon:yes gene_type:complete
VIKNNRSILYRVSLGPSARDLPGHMSGAKSCGRTVSNLAQIGCGLSFQSLTYIAWGFLVVAVSIVTTTVVENVFSQSVPLKKICWGPKKRLKAQVEAP